MPRGKRVRFRRVEIVAGDGKSPARDVAREVRAHHAEADDPDLVHHLLAVRNAVD